MNYALGFNDKRRRLDTMASIGRFAWNNRDAIRQAVMARTARRARGRYRMMGMRKVYGRYSLNNSYVRKRRRVALRNFSAKNFGFVPGGNTSKTQTAENLSGTGRNTRALYQINMTEIQKYSGPDDAANERIRNIVNFKGMKVCMEWRNLSDTVLQCHMAILCPRKSTTVSIQDFFSNPAEAERGKNFNNNLSSTEYNCLPINTDEYVILHHKRYQRGRQGDDVGTGEDNTSGKRNYRALHQRQPINRQIRYTDNTNTPADGNVILVYWADSYLTAAGSTPTNNAFQCNIWIVKYFKEPK